MDEDRVLEVSEQLREICSYYENEEALQALLHACAATIVSRSSALEGATETVARATKTLPKLVQHYWRLKRPH